MTEILTKPTEPGLYWCRNVHGHQGASFTIYEPDKDRWYYFGSDFYEHGFSHMPAPGEYMVAQPDWPTQPPGLVEIETGDGERVWATQVAHNDSLGVIKALGSYKWANVNCCTIIANPHNDPTLEAKIREAQG